MNENKPIVIPVTEAKLCATVNFNWFLEDAEKFDDGTRSQQVPATFKALVNGKETFEELHDRIANAKSSIDIAIWGFQPSMHLKRDGKSPCIGDLLIEKALVGVKVRILVWSLPGDVQTAQEANLGNKPGVFKGRVEGVTDAQANYDRWWFEAIQGDLDEVIVNNKTEGVIHVWNVDEIENYKKLIEFTQSPKRTNLVYKNRKVAAQSDDFNPRELPDGTRVNHSFKDTTLPDGKGTLLDGSYDFALKNFKSHHQKTVLIDYDKPESAVGFVLEHNMLDNYWDNDEHSLKTTAPDQGKNAQTPLQDVSSIVTGQVLWDINYNFCQSWDRNTNKQWGRDAVERNLTEQRKKFMREQYTPNPKLVEESKLLMAQIVRTYDEPNVEDIMKVYLKNIKQTTSYLYTENQYFRFPPLVREFIAHWETLKNGGRTEGPIHWFAVTNSSDLGIGAGTYTTNEMFKLLGKQDVMPGVALNIRLKELQAALRKQKINEVLLENERMRVPTAEGKQAVSAEQQRTAREIKRLEEQITQIKARQQENGRQSNEHAPTERDGQIENQYQDESEANLTKELGYELSDTPGIKAHICTLMPKDENGKYIHAYKKGKKSELAEVYVHSKVTIMDDVFTVISSANLNTRSMQVDTELGIIMECADVAEGLRKRLWDLHTNKDGAANPDDMHDYAVAKEAFRIWGELMRANKDAQKRGTSLTCALREFYRADPTVSRSD